MPCLERCGNMFCVYWRENRCLLDEVELDHLGCCDACITVAPGEELLEPERERLRRILEE